MIDPNCRRLIGFLILIVLSFLSPLSSPALTVGYSRVHITPAYGTDIPGYFVARHVKGVRDPLSVVTLAFSDGVRTAVVQTLPDDRKVTVTFAWTGTAAAEVLSDDFRK